jgi:hypothetical protein
VGSDGFVRAPAVGGACWHGYGFLGGDAGSIINPKDFSACGAGCQLTLSGTVNAGNQTNSYAGYAYLGFYVAEAPGTATHGTVTPKGSSLVVTWSGNFAGTRMQLASGTTTWCAPFQSASPATIPYSSFNTACWDYSGSAYAKQAIDRISLDLPGAPTTTTGVSVTLISVSEN